MSEILPQGYYYNYKDSYDLYKTMKRVIKEQKEIKYKEKTYPDCEYSWERMVNIIVKAIKEKLV
jgi:hypothetical protein